MKILFETGSTCVGGAERVILRVAQGIRKLHPDWQLDAAVLCDRGGLEQEYRETFATIHDGPGANNYRASGLFLANLCLHNKYDVCHAIDSFEHTAFAARAYPDTRFVQNVFPNIEKSPFAPSARWMADKNLPYAALVTEFKANGELLPELPRGEVLVIPNGIDTDFWTPGEADVSVSRDVLRDIDVIWCARTDPEKGIGMAMEIVPLLCGAGLKYVIVTSEPDGPHMELVRTEGVYRAFETYSRKSPNELRSLFRRSKIFLSTSQVEGMPATPLESSACGCYPLVPSVDGLTECFGPSDERFEGWPTFTYRSSLNTRGLAIAIQEIVGFISRGEWDNDIAREIACRYSLESMVKGYLALYESVTGA